jgi:hypothetical protein
VNFVSDSATEGEGDEGPSRPAVAANTKERQGKQGKGREGKVTRRGRLYGSVVREPGKALLGSMGQMVDMCLRDVGVTVALDITARQVVPLDEIVQAVQALRSSNGPGFGQNSSQWYTRWTQEDRLLDRQS